MGKRALLCYFAAAVLVAHGVPWAISRHLKSTQAKRRDSAHKWSVNTRGCSTIVTLPSMASSEKRLPVANLILPGGAWKESHQSLQQMRPPLFVVVVVVLFLSTLAHNEVLCCKLKFKWREYPMYLPAFYTLLLLRVYPTYTLFSSV